MKMHVQTYAGLTTRVVERDSTVPPRLIIVLSHGYGASGTDLIGLAGELAGAFPALGEGVRFVFPEAPNMAPGMAGMMGGRAWFPIDEARFIQWAQSGDMTPFMTSIPEGLDASQALLNDAISAIAADAGLPMDRVVIGGFSQGAMVSTGVVLAMDENPAMLVVLSGALVAGERWVPQAPSRAGLSVFQSHGTEDPVLPYPIAEALSAVLTRAELDVTFLAFKGGHTIDRSVLHALGERLVGLLESV